MNSSDHRLDQQPALRRLAVVGLILVLGAFLYAFANAGAAVQSALIAAGSAIALATYSYREQHRRTEKEAHRIEKVAAYSDFFEIMFEVLKRKELAEIESFLQQAETQDRTRKFWRSVLFYGSPEVVIAYTNWNRAAVRNGSGESFVKVASMILAMRKDIGLSNAGLDEKNIINFLTRPNPDGAEHLL